MANSIEHFIIAYVVFFVCSLIFSLLINGLFLKFSKSLGIRNTNDTVIRWGPQSKPAFGGISFFIIFLFSIIADSILFGHNDYFQNIQFIGIILSITLGFLMGLFDDAYNTRPILKFITQFSCGVILIVTGTYIHLFSYAPLNYILTLFWIVGMMNSINMLDNMDAVVSVVSMFILLTIGINLVLLDEFYYSTSDLFLVIGCFAALSGFLIYNWYPSKIYMGDTGSQFLGVFLAVMGIKYLWNVKDFNHHIIPSKQLLSVCLVFLIPLIDTTTVVIKRISKGKSPFVGGKDHTTHYLAHLLSSDRKVIYVMSGIAFFSSVLTIWIIDFSYQWNYIYSLIICIYILAVFSALFIITFTEKAENKKR